MTEFKVGDRVRATKDCAPAVKGEVYTLTKRNGSLMIEVEGQIGLCCCRSTWELVERAEFKVGDKVICIKDNCEFKEGHKTIITRLRLKDSNNDYLSNSGHEDATIYIHDPEQSDNEKWVFSKFWKVVEEETNNKEESSKKETMEIEELKTFSEENLADGKERAEEDKANYEAEEAKKAYTALVDRKEAQERIIRVAKEELKKIEDDLKIFGK